MNFFAGIVIGVSLSTFVILLARRRLAASHLRMNAIMVDAVIDNAIDAIITISDTGSILTFNPAAAVMFDYSPTDVIGKNVSVLMPEPDRSRHDDYLKQYLQSGKGKIIGIGREVSCERRDGSRFSADLAISEMPAGHAARFTGILRDLTDRKRIEQQLAGSTRRMNMVLQANHLIAWEYDALRGKVRITRCSDPSVSPESLFTTVDFDAALDRVHPDDCELIMAILGNKELCGSSVPVEYRILDRHGNERWVRNNFLCLANQPEQCEWTGISRDITKAKATESRLLSLGRILENSRNEVYVFDASSLKFLLVNRCARQNLQYGVNEMTSMTPLSLKQDLSKKEFDQLLEPLRNGKQTAVSFRALHYRLDGSSYPVDEYIMPGTHAGVKVYFSIILDITDRLQQQEQLRLKDEELQLTLRLAPLGIATLDAKGKLLTMNASGERITGYRESDIIGTFPINHIQEDEKAETLKVLNSLKKGQKEFSVSTHRVRHASGEYIFIQSHNAVVHDAEGKPRMIISMFLDITEQRATESELQEQRQRLTHVARLGIMGEMAAGLAHEINQPLAAIATYAQASQRLLTINHIDSEDISHALHQVTEQAHRAGNVIKRIRALAKGASLKREPIQIHKLLDEIRPLIEIDARNANVEVEYEIQPDLPAVFLDTIQIQQVLLNFIRNGVDELVCARNDNRKLIIMASRVSDQSVRIAVRDNGSGVPADLVEKLFHPYFTTKESGMGMGLSISKSILLSHDGKIGYQPTDQGGAEFWMTIPIDPVHESSEPG